MLTMCVFHPPSLTPSHQALQLLALIYTSEPLLTWVYIRHMTGLFSKGVMNLKVGQKGGKERRRSGNNGHESARANEVYPP